MVLNKGTTNTVLNLHLSEFNFVTRAIQRSPRVNKGCVGGCYSVFFIFLRVKLHVPLEDKVNIYPRSTIAVYRVYILLGKKVVFA